jgi:hypothetical protein
METAVSSETSGLISQLATSHLRVSAYLGIIHPVVSYSVRTVLSEVSRLVVSSTVFNGGHCGIPAGRRKFVKSGFSEWRQWPRCLVSRNLSPVLILGRTRHFLLFVVSR